MIITLVREVIYSERELKDEGTQKKNPLIQKSVSFAIEKMDYITIYKQGIDLGFCNVVCRIKNHL